MSEEKELADDLSVDVEIVFGIEGKYGVLKRGDKLSVDPQYAGMLQSNGCGKLAESESESESESDGEIESQDKKQGKKPKSNKAAKPGRNK